ncbi:MAG: YhjD/YihY/BrkB family envelope integrity protein [Acidimicrobiia bacterium]
MSEDLAEVSPEPDQVDEPSDGRWRKYVGEARARAESARASAEARRPQSRILDSAFRVYERNRVLPASVLVGALASRIVIYLIPLVALVVFAFGQYADIASESASELVRQAGMAGIVAAAADDAAVMDGDLRLVVLIATIWAALYAANGLGRLIRRIHAFIWGVTYRSPPRPWLVPLFVLVMTVVGWFFTTLGALEDTLSVEFLIGAITVELICMTMIWMVIGRILPHDPGISRWGEFFPGALFVAVGVVGLRVALVVYFAPHVDTLTERYGSIAIALILLTWAYWLGMIVVGSAEINAALFRSRSQKPD